MRPQRHSNPQSLAIVAFRRFELERWIDQAIALLDTMDGDADLEDDEIEDIHQRGPPLGGIIGGGGLRYITDAIQEVSKNKRYTPLSRSLLKAKISWQWRKLTPRRAVDLPQRVKSIEWNFLQISYLIHVGLAQNVKYV